MKYKKFAEAKNLVVDVEFTPEFRLKREIDLQNIPQIIEILQNPEQRTGIPEDIIAKALEILGPDYTDQQLITENQNLDIQEGIWPYIVNRLLDIFDYFPGDCQIM